MAKIETMTISQFMNRSTHSRKDTIFRWLEKNKIAYRVIGVTIIIFASGIIDPTAFASTGIDVGAEKIYAKLLNVGKWCIIIKGAWETINNTIKGDFDTAKKSFLQYLIVYIILLAFPWAMDEVDALFNDL